MKKAIAMMVFLLSLMFLAGCEGDYTLTNVRIIEKTTIDNKYQITVEKNDSQYSYTVDKYNYDQFKEGSLVDIQYHVYDGVTIFPGGSDR